MQTREIKGLEIASSSKLTRNGQTWIVPSQSGRNVYTVNLDPEPPTCTCPDYESRAQKCKHIYAVEHTLRGEQQGEKPAAPPERARPTYKQEWPAYNLAQTNEKALFQSLLYELCQGIEEPMQRFGRPRLPFAEMVFCAAFKVYSTFSGRRFISDLREAKTRGYIFKCPHFNSISNYLELEGMTAYLKELIALSSLPLKAVETDFAVDSSGFSTGRFVRWFDVKYGGVEDARDWIKLHLMCGVKTNVVTSVEVSRRYAGDSPYFKPLVEKTAQAGFQMREVSADKAYLSADNLRVTLLKGAIPYIPFKSNNTTSAKSTIWNRLFHFYSYHQEEFGTHYHKRSNVESTFAMIKAKFGERVRSKSETAQTNEALCKVLCHNLCCVIQSVYELGIEATFCAETEVAQNLLSK